MTVRNVLYINAATYVGGDVAMILLGLPALDPGRFRLHVVSPPRGHVYAAFQAMPNAILTTMDLGGSEAAPPGRTGKLARAADTAAAIARIVQLVRRNKIDLIYTVDRTISLPLSYAVARLTGCPLVLSAHIGHYLHTSPVHRHIVRNAHSITVTSENMRQEFLPFARSHDQLVKIMNAIRVDRYDPSISGEAVRVELQIPPDAPVVLLAGRLNPFKGQDDLVRAAAVVLKQRPDTYFLIAGGENVPGHLALIEGLIAEHGVGHRVRCIGYRQDLPQLFATSDIATMPSHNEPFGLVALEAMAMGKPVVATRAGGVPEFLVDGEMGLLIPPRDSDALARAILTLLDDPARARAMGQRGRQHVLDHFNEEVYGKQIADFLYTVRPRPSPGPLANQHSRV